MTSSDIIKRGHSLWTFKACLDQMKYLMTDLWTLEELRVIWDTD